MGSRTATRARVPARTPGTPTPAAVQRSNAAPVREADDPAHDRERARLGHRFDRVAPAPPDVPVAPPGSGRLLPPSVRQAMEASLGADFGGVRLHEGPEAARVGAIAYTRGEHVHFAPGQPS